MKTKTCNIHTFARKFQDEYNFCYAPTAKLRHLCSLWNLWDFLTNGKSRGKSDKVYPHYTLNDCTSIIGVQD